MNELFDCLIIGAGPAGVSAGLNMVRARRRVLIIDSNRPRHAATLASHGFITRDGISPLELRQFAREEFERYPEAHFHQGVVFSIGVTNSESGHEFVVRSRGIRGAADRTARSRTLLIATGLVETLPNIPTLRAFYGTSLHSCIACDAYEKSDAPLALIGETDDLADWALQLSHHSRDLIVFTNGVGVVSERDAAALARRGIRLERTPIADVLGDPSGLTGIQLVDGTIVPRTAGFVRPVWSAALDYDALVGVEMTDDRLVSVDARGRTSLDGVFAAGDSTPPGARQLIVAAGEGARVAESINRYLIGALD